MDNQGLTLIGALAFRSHPCCRSRIVVLVRDFRGLAGCLNAGERAPAGTMSVGLTGFEVRSSWRFLVLEGDEAGCGVINTTSSQARTVHLGCITTTLRRVMYFCSCVYNTCSSDATRRAVAMRAAFLRNRRATDRKSILRKLLRHTAPSPPCHLFSSAFSRDAWAETAEKFGRACKLYIDVIDASLMRDRCEYAVL